MKELENTVVHLRNQVEYDECMKMFAAAGWKWANESDPCAKCYSEEYSGVRVRNLFNRGSIEWYKNNGIKIITLNKLKDMQKKTLKDLEVGDILLDGDGDKVKILAVLHRGDKMNESVYILSYHNDYRKSTHPYTSYELSNNGYTIKGQEEKPEELTMEEVCAELGRVIKIKK